MESAWWGRFDLEIGQTSEWVIGPLQLAIQRLAQEWQIGCERQRTGEETDYWQQELTERNISDTGYAQKERYVFDKTDENLTIRPLLADRSIVIRPLMPLHVPAGEKAIIYVSTPLWITIEVGSSPRTLSEIAVQRPSDTWFGPSTLEGELCYITRTYGRLNFENIPLRSYRAITQIHIRNEVNSILTIERLSLPVPYLSLFSTPEKLLWTQPITMIRTRDTGMAAINIEKDLSEETKEAESISGPRTSPQKNMIVRTFGAFSSLVRF